MIAAVGIRLLDVYLIVVIDAGYLHMEGTLVTGAPAVLVAVGDPRPGPRIEVATGSGSFHLGHGIAAIADVIHLGCIPISLYRRLARCGHDVVVAEGDHLAVGQDHHPLFGGDVIPSLVDCPPGPADQIAACRATGHQLLAVGHAGGNHLAVVGRDGLLTGFVLGAIHGDIRREVAEGRWNEIIHPDRGRAFIAVVAEVAGDELDIVLTDIIASEGRLAEFQEDHATIVGHPVVNVRRINGDRIARIIEIDVQTLAGHVRLEGIDHLYRGVTGSHVVAPVGDDEGDRGIAQVGTGQRGRRDGQGNGAAGIRAAVVDIAG